MTLMIKWSLCLNIDPCPFSNENRNWSQRLWASVLVPKAGSSSCAVSIDSVTYWSTPLTILTQETGWSWNRFDQNVNSVLVFMATNFMTKTGPILVVFENPSSCTSLLLVSKHRVFSTLMLHLLSFLFQEFRSVVLFRQASNPHRGTVGITSGLPTIIRIFARILSPGFDAAVHWSDFLQWEGR